MSFDEYYCTNCNAILNDQPGFDPDKGTWTCTNCGHMMMAEDVYNSGDKFEGVAWICDNCGSLLNRQKGFTDSCGSWKCTKCGHKNGITEDDIVKYKCPSCYAPLDIQPGFVNGLISWTCTNCDSHLEYSFIDEEYKKVENKKTSEQPASISYVDDEPKHKCPNCGSDLDEQDDYDDYDDDWTCTECGAKLHHDYSDEEYEVVGYDKKSISHSTYSSTTGNTYTTHSPQKQQNDTGKSKSNSIVEAFENLVEIVKGVISLILLVGLIAFAVWYFNSCSPFSNNDKGENHPDEIKLTSSASSYKNENYYDAIISLKQQGLSDIKLIPLKDLKTGILSKYGSIEKIEINGVSDFKSNTWVKQDSVVSISYHSFEKKEKREFDTIKNNHLILSRVDIPLPTYFIEEGHDAEKATYHVKGDEETKLMVLFDNEHKYDFLGQYESHHVQNLEKRTSTIGTAEYTIALGKKDSKVYSINAITIKLHSKEKTLYIILTSLDNSKVDYVSDFDSIISGIYVPQDSEVRIDFTNKDYKGKKYEDVVNDLQNKGFKNIRTENLKDILLGVFSKEGTVEKITISGNADFKSGSWVSEQAEIVISYHGKK